MSAVTTFFTTGKIEYFNCGFRGEDGSWIKCLITETSGRILPAAFIAGFWGLVKVISTQFGVFAQVDTPPYEGPPVEGGRVENVDTFYYVLDTLSETFWNIGELTIGSILLWYTAIAMIGYNAYYGSFVWYGLIGLVQLFAVVFWSAQLLIRTFYNIVNLQYLTQYDVATYSTITFYDPITILSSDLDDTQLIIWFEQLLFGNRRSQLYVNILMAAVFSLHPMTMILAWFFLFQIPTGLLFEIVVYPLFPQFDTPYIPWTAYIEYAVNGFEFPPVEEADADKPKPKKDDDIIIDEDAKESNHNQFILQGADYVVFGDVE